MTDIILPECASCLNMRGPLSHLASDFYSEATSPEYAKIGLRAHLGLRSDSPFKPVLMNNRNVLCFELLIPLTVISCSVFTADVLFIFQISFGSVLEHS